MATKPKTGKYFDDQTVQFDESNRYITAWSDTEQDLLDFIRRTGIVVNPRTQEYNLDTHKTSLGKNIRRRFAPTERSVFQYSYYKGMPPFACGSSDMFCCIRFICDAEKWTCERLSELFGQDISPATKSIKISAIPPDPESEFRKYCVVSDTVDQGDYPIYVVSKGRATRCTTSEHLSRMGVYHYVVVEPDEVAIYQEHVANEYATILELDMSYKDNYDTFDDLGDTKNKGPGGARNFCWEHSISNGDKWHWVMDDNAVGGFYYMWNHLRVRCKSPNIFRAMQDFVERFDNLAIAGMNYMKFVHPRRLYGPLILNSRVYSFLLIRNDIPYRWRGRYNEDTDLCLRVLKDGWCTVQFNGFLADKASTQTVKGGNTDEFYSLEGTRPKSDMLKEMHPDVTTVLVKFGRWHHQVDYSKFLKPLNYKDGYVPPDTPNDYGMRVVRVNELVTKLTHDEVKEKYGTQTVHE